MIMKNLNIYTNTLLIAISTLFLSVNIHAQSTSNFSTGTTFTQYSLDPWGNTAAIERGENLLLNSTKIINQHLMGFGALNPEPYPNNYDFSTIERRIGNDTGLGDEAETIVLTACCAPDWMKGGTPGTTDWSRIEIAPFPQHFDDYADLVAEVVRRPEFSNIKYVQVWNEMKGFWDVSRNRWNHEAYTDLYNKVWTAVKTVRPDIKIGGPYVVLGSWGSNTTGSGQWFSSDVGGAWGKFDSRDIAVVEYWLQNKIGADFITLDASITNRDNIYPVNQFERTKKFADFMTWLRSLDNSAYPGATSLPVWWAEWYSIPENSNASQAEKNALMTTTLVQMIKSGASTALVWGPQGDTNGNMFPLALFTDTRISSGGQATIFHSTQKYLYDHFSAGTTLLNASTNNTNIKVLASNNKTLLVNTTNSYQTLTFRGLTLALQAYEVKLIDTPQIGGGDNCNLLTNGDFSNGTTDWSSWRCNTNISSGACRITNIQTVQNAWDVAFVQGNFILEYGKQYEISFDANSIQNNRAIKVKAGLSENPYTNYHYQTVYLNTNNQRFTIPFTMSYPTTTKGRLEFHLGTNTSGLVLDNIRLKPTAEDCPNECEQVKNGSFTEGSTDWYVQRCTITPTGNGANIDIPYILDNFWDIALKQRGLTYEQGKEYRISFQAKADANRSIHVKAGKASAPYTQYHLEKIELTTALQNHTLTFIMNNTTDSDAFLEFFFGDSTTDLFLGDISLEETGCDGEFREGSFNDIISHYEVFPNPVHDNLNVSLHLTDGYNTGIIRLFDLNGRIILEEEKALSATNQLQLNIQAIPAGMYMLRVDVGGYFLTHKVVKH